MTDFPSLPLLALALRPGTPSELAFIRAITHPTRAAYVTAPAKRQAAGFRNQNGVAVIDIQGPLLHRTTLDRLDGWLQGYQDIATQLDAALVDSAIKAIVLNIDSPGGVADGCAQLADQILAARGQKPIHACISDQGTSAAYWIAAAADKVSAAKTAQIGSIGVRAMHIDLSKVIDGMGLKITEIYAGNHKIDGTPYAPLSESALAAFQSNIDYTYDLFCAAVATARQIDKATVVATQAAILDPPAAKKIGLIDAIEPPDTVITRLAKRYGGSSSPTRAAARRSTAMSETPDRYAADGPVITQAQIDAARTEGYQAGLQEGRKTERARLAAVLALPEAEGREAQAKQLALTTDLAPTACAGILAAGPKIEMLTAQSEFAAHMAALGNPQVGPDSAGQPANQEASDAWRYAFAQAPTK